MKTSLLLKSAAVLLTALALGVFLFARVAVDAQAPSPAYDLLITNARIVDGSGNPWFRADVEISHFKISNKKLWGQSPMTLGLVREARARGLVVTVDQYAYTASSTSLDSRLPSWLRAGGLDESKKRLADKATRERADQATFDKPHQFPLGISYVLVNGAPVIDNNQLTTTRPGVALRGPQLIQMTQKSAASVDRVR